MAENLFATFMTEHCSKTCKWLPGDDLQY